eukprot:11312227-Heterocapsa_arctica.AAC.1
MFAIPLERLVAEFTEYNTAVAATGHTSPLVIASLGNSTAFVRDPRALLVSISRNKQFMILTGDVTYQEKNGSPQVQSVIKMLRELGLIIPTYAEAYAERTPGPNEPKTWINLDEEGAAWDLVELRLKLVKAEGRNEDDWASK